MKFELDLNHRAHGMKAIEAHSLSLEQMQNVRQIICANHFDDPWYHCKQGLGPFLQGYDDAKAERGRGWVFVEFWCEDSEIERLQKYINMLNEEVFGEREKQHGQ